MLNNIPFFKYSLSLERLMRMLLWTELQLYRNVLFILNDESSLRCDENNTCTKIKYHLNDEESIKCGDIVSGKVRVCCIAFADF